MESSIYFLENLQEDNLWKFCPSNILCQTVFIKVLQCSRAREPTFKNLYWELPELEKSVKYISLTVLSEKEVI